ncbi:PH domain-containing protein [Embleya sp. NBC_00896]|uniref:PH domain-containing protein n=1 Tax=Embleya sp. NBC_00896 TaxID=2975961 RepID=UPI003869B180
MVTTGMTVLPVSAVASAVFRGAHRHDSSPAPADRTTKRQLPLAAITKRDGPVRARQPCTRR